MKFSLKIISLALFLATFIFFPKPTEAQEKSPNSYKPLVIKFDETGDSYIRFILWNQVWLNSNNLSASYDIQLSASIRRSRLLTYAQVSPRLLILSHFGLNGLHAGNLSALGNESNAPQIFLHGAWGEYKISNSIYAGAGLHYWRGLTRLSNQSTLNFMTLDQSRPFNAWHSLGITDQFARHLGVYVKGDYQAFEYRFAWNTPGKSPLGEGKDYSAYFNADGAPKSTLVYKGVSTPDLEGNVKGSAIFEGYIKYNFWESESTKLPYYVGTYLGKKKVLAIGAGFFAHPNGMYDTEKDVHSHVLHFAADVFMDTPIPGGALNLYAAFQKFNYGANYISRWGGTGYAWYGQAGYYSELLKTMPYISFSHSNYEGADQPIQALDIGINYFIQGHHCKLTAEYHVIMRDYREGEISYGGVEDLSQFRLQFQVFL